jgi:hypothetical protein
MRYFIVFLRPAPALRDKTGTWPLDRITVRQEQGPAGFDLGNLRFWFNGVPSRLRGWLVRPTLTSVRRPGQDCGGCPEA